MFTLMNIKPAISDQIRDRRKQLGISQRDLAEIAGVSLHTLSDLESGRGNPTVATLQRVLAPLGLVLSVHVRDIG